MELAWNGTKMRFAPSSLNNAGRYPCMPAGPSFAHTPLRQGLEHLYAEVENDTVAHHVLVKIARVHPRADARRAAPIFPMPGLAVPGLTPAAGATTRSPAR